MSNTRQSPSQCDELNALTIALGLAETGLPVFPCDAQKRPSIAKAEGGRGMQDATCNPDAIQCMFSRDDAVLVGVPTGGASGIDVLDVDPRHGGDLWEAENRHRLPETRVHETMSGGHHWLFSTAPGVRNSAGRIALGIDVRGGGGYTIFPPSPGYRVIDEAPVAHWPDWLLREGLVLPKPKPARQPTAPSFEPVSQEQIQRILDGALDRVRGAPDGQKHFVLRNNALLLGGIADCAGLSDADLTDRLLGALPSGVQDWEGARKTAQWGLEQGRCSPLDIPREPRLKAPDPRRKAVARAAFRLLRMNVPSDDLLNTLHALNARQFEPLPAGVVADTALWAAKQLSGRSHG